MKRSASVIFVSSLALAACNHEKPSVEIPEPSLTEQIRIHAERICGFLPAARKIDDAMAAFTGASLKGPIAIAGVICTAFNQIPKAQAPVGAEVTVAVKPRPDMKAVLISGEVKRSR